MHIAPFCGRYMEDQPQLCHWLNMSMNFNTLTYRQMLVFTSKIVMRLNMLISGTQ